MPVKRGFTIEDKIRPLVDALNSISYIQTIASCEGHFESEDYESHHANVIFEVKKEDKPKVEGLANLILGETVNSLKGAVVQVSNRYYRVPENKTLRDNWEIEIIPLDHHEVDIDAKRRKTDCAINKVIEIVNKYAKEYICV